MDLKNFEKPEYFVNRELSWLKFDDRVLSEARDKSLPLFERLKFTSIDRPIWMSLYGSCGFPEGSGSCRL